MLVPNLLTLATPLPTAYHGDITRAVAFKANSYLHAARNM